MPVPKDPELYEASGSASGLPTSPGPLPSSPAPEAEEPLPGGPVEQSEPEEVTPDPPAEFDPRVKDKFSGLLYLGKLEKKFTWLGHDFRIRTLKSGELLEVALVVREYADTIGASRAYADATAAACLMEVDGKALPIPITTAAEDTGFTNRFEYVSNTYHPPVIDKIYEQYLILEEQVQDAIRAMGEAVG